jgi:hypothetical protein
MSDDEEEQISSESISSFEKWLKALEFTTVVAIVTCALLVCGYEIFWICTGGTWNDAHLRFQDALTRMDTHWKLGIVLLIPLFYRTIRDFLERAEKAFGIDAPRIPKTISLSSAPQSSDKEP